MAFSSDMILCNRYRLIEKIGMGGFSDVWTARDDLISTIVVLKIFVRQDEEGIEMCRNEYKKLVGLNHPHIVRILGLEVYEGAPILVMPFYAGGSVVHLSGELTEYELAELMYQMADALSYIHYMSPAIVHGDIKPDNFLSDARNNYVLTDFGISEHLESKLTKSASADRLTKVLAGKNRAGITPMSYRAPELFSFKGQKRQAPSRQTDIWALGVSIFELAAGELPFGSEGGLILLIGSEEKGIPSMDDFLPSLRPDFSNDFIILLKSCLSANASERPTADFIKNSARNYIHNKRWLLLDSVPTEIKEDQIKKVDGNNKNAPNGNKKRRVFRSGKRGVSPSLLWLFVILVVPILGNAIYFYTEYKINSDLGDRYMGEKRFEEAYRAYQCANVLPFFTDKLRERTWHAQFRSKTKSYPNIRPFSEGLAAVSDSLQKFGFVDSTGRLIIGTIYNSADDFKEGKSEVLFNKTWYIIDYKGNKISSATGNVKFGKNSEKH